MLRDALALKSALVAHGAHRWSWSDVRSLSDGKRTSSGHRQSVANDPPETFDFLIAYPEFTASAKLVADILRFKLGARLTSNPDITALPEQPARPSMAASVGTVR